jgi:TPR repeat protein
MDDGHEYVGVGMMLTKLLHLAVFLCLSVTKPGLAAESHLTATDTEVCSRAIDISKRDWDMGYSSREWLAEAEKRRLKVPECLSLIGSPIEALTDAEICKRALDPSGRDWDLSYSQRAWTTEAAKRQLSITGCVDLLRARGEPPAESIAAASQLEAAFLAAQRGDFATARKHLELSAKQGNAQAQNILGTLYEKGQGGVQDYKIAAKWYRAAADQGLAEGQYNLGALYHNGTGVKRNFAEAIKWYRLAAAQSLPQAFFILAIMHENGVGVAKDQKEALNLYRQAAEGGMAEAQNTLGAIYHEGKLVPKDDREAMRWYRLAAAQGHARSQYNMGVMYLNAQGVELDFAEGFKWSLLAAKQGHTTAQHNVAVAYENGRGVQKDTVRALVWFDLAAQNATIQTCMLDKGKECSPSKNRNRLRKQLSKAELAEAVKLIQRCKETSYQQCD